MPLPAKHKPNDEFKRKRLACAKFYLQNMIFEKKYDNYLLDIYSIHDDFKTIIIAIDSFFSNSFQEFKKNFPSFEFEGIFFNVDVIHYSPLYNPEGISQYIFRSSPDEFYE
jgi:hypothetical protein